jgi:UDP-glucose 4-epimerase
VTLPLEQTQVLVTGVTGFIGRHVCRKLVELGVATYGLSRSATEATVPPGVIPIAADVTHRDAIIQALERIRPSHVLHLAAAGVNNPLLSEEEATQVNVSGTLHVLQASQAVQIQRYIQVGTCYEYMADAHHSNTYAVSKLAGWHTWRTFLTPHSIETAALRLFHIYGPEQPTTGLIAAAIHAALHDERFELTPGEQLRDFVFLDDVVDALLMILTAPLSGMKTYDVGTGVGCSVRSVVQRIFEKVGGKGEAAVGARPYRSSEIMRLVADPQPATQDFAWRTQTDVEMGLTMTIDWQRQQLMPRIAGTEHNLA